MLLNHMAPRLQSITHIAKVNELRGDSVNVPFSARFVFCNLKGVSMCLQPFATSFPPLSLQDRGLIPRSVTALFEARLCAKLHALRDRAFAFRPYLL